MYSKVKISVIIPIYNAGKYLSETLASLRQQRFEDFEVLMIDDGSTDDSATIARNFATSDSRFKYIHKTNGGVSSARNLGLESAIGEWIYFCDADDYVLPTGLFRLISKAKTGIELVACEHETITPQNKCIQPPSDKDITFSSAEYAESLFKGISERYQGYLWNKLFNAAIIRRHNLMFNPNISYNEDRLFIFSYICCLKGNIAYSTLPVYRYYLRGDGAMGSLDNKDRYHRFESDLEAYVECHHLAAVFGSERLNRLIEWGAYISWRKNRKLIKKHSSHIALDLKRITNTLHSVCKRRQKIFFTLRLGFTVMQNRIGRIFN